MKIGEWFRYLCCSFIAFSFNGATSTSASQRGGARAGAHSHMHNKSVRLSIHPRTAIAGSVFVSFDAIDSCVISFTAPLSPDARGLGLVDGVAGVFLPHGEDTLL